MSYLSADVQGGCVRRQTWVSSSVHRRLTAIHESCSHEDSELSGSVKPTQTHTHTHTRVSLVYIICRGRVFICHWHTRVNKKDANVVVVVTIIDNNDGCNMQQADVPSSCECLRQQRGCGWSVETDVLTTSDDTQHSGSVQHTSFSMVVTSLCSALKQVDGNMKQLALDYTSYLT